MSETLPARRKHSARDATRDLHVFRTAFFNWSNSGKCETLMSGNLRAVQFTLGHAWKENAGDRYLKDDLKKALTISEGVEI